MLSGIQHFAFCRRQWALIHIEQQWAENYRTVDGQIFHENAHNDIFSESRNGVLIRRGLSVYSRVMGISGICDVVEFHPTNGGISIPYDPNSISLYLLSIKEVSPSNIKRMICSFVHKRCVWKKCSYAVLIKDIYIMARHGEELRFCSLRICEKQ